MVALARSPLLAGALGYDALAEALLECATRRTSLVGALLATHAMDEDRLEAALEAPGGTKDVRVVALTPFVALLPHGLCERLFAIPVAHDAATGTVAIALADVDDAHALAEMAFWLSAPVRPVRAPLAALRTALDSLAESPSTQRGPFPAGREAKGGAPDDLTKRAGLRGEPRAPAAGRSGGSRALEAAAARDEVFELLVATSRSVARHVLVLVVRHGALVAWTCSPEVGAREPLRRWQLPLAPRSVLREALDRGHASWVRLPVDDAHAPLLEALRARPEHDLVIAPVVVDRRRAGIVVAGEMHEPGTALARLEELARSAGDSLARLLRAQQPPRPLSPPPPERPRR